MHHKREIFERTLRKYIGPEYLEDIIQLMLKYPVHFKITKPRKTKLGDFRVEPGLSLPTITVNGNLNKYAFLVTTIHEFAHLLTYNEYGWKKKPHGEEWQRNYIHLMLPIIERGHLPKELEKILMNSLVNVKASSCTDLKLHRALSHYDELEDGYTYLERLAKEDKFVLQGKTFTKGNLRRSRFVCIENKTQKIYLVNALAKVQKSDNE